LKPPVVEFFNYRLKFFLGPGISRTYQLESVLLR